MTVKEYWTEYLRQQENAIKDKRERKEHDD